MTIFILLKVNIIMCFWRARKWGSESLNNWPVITQSASGSLGSVLAVWIQKCFLFPLSWPTLSPKSLLNTYFGSIGLYLELKIWSRWLEKPPSVKGAFILVAEWQRKDQAGKHPEWQQPCRQWKEPSVGSGYGCAPMPPATVISVQEVVRSRYCLSSAVKNPPAKQMWVWSPGW